MHKKNIGISLLKIILSYSVVCIHFWNSEMKCLLNPIVSFFCSYAVYLFVFISFYFCQAQISEHRPDRIRERFIRLIIPQVGWTIIYCVLYELMDVLFGQNKISGMEDFWWQLFTGSRKGINQTMYFQIDLIFLTLMFLLVVCLCKEKSTVVILSITLITLAMEYCGMLVRVDNLRYELRYLVGRFFEFIPFATCGFMLSKYKIMSQISAKKSMAVLLAGGVIVIEICSGSRIRSSDFINSGVITVSVACAIFIFFYLISLERVPVLIVRMIEGVSRYSLAVYCMHRLTETILRGIFEVFGYEILFDTLGKCLVIYSICVLSSVIAVKIIPNKYFKMLFV